MREPTGGAGRTAKVSFLAALGHVAVSLILGVALAAAGLALRHAVVAEEGQIVGGVLVLTGMGFSIWAVRARAHGHGQAHQHGHTHAYPHAHTHPHGHTHDHAAAPQPEHTHVDGGAPDHDHGHDAGHHHHHHGDGPSDDHDHEGGHDHHDQDAGHRPAGRRGSWLGEIAVPFGVAASPDLTILPVFLAASAVGIGAAVGALVTFTLATLARFVVLTVAATIGGYQVEWPWLETNGQIVSALMLLLIGVLVFVRV